jgi:DNA replication licensing factor MCM2
MCHAAVSAIARYLVDAPTEVLKILDDAAMRVILEIFPEYKNIANEIHVRITDLPVSDSLRSLRYSTYQLN